jgi:hypothetical protein
VERLLVWVLKKFFEVGRSGFLFVFWVLFGFLDGVSGSVFAVLACAFMLVSVKFHVVKREV